MLYYISSFSKFIVVYVIGVESGLNLLHLESQLSGMPGVGGGGGACGSVGAMQPIPQLHLQPACSCLNCKMGLNAHAFNEDGTPRKKRHICHYPDCTRVYENASLLRAHLRGHTGERPFACRWNYCGKRFTRSSDLHRHHRTHTGEKKFKCMQCGKRFMRRDHLSKHTKIHQKLEHRDTESGHGSEDIDIGSNTPSDSVCSTSDSFANTTDSTDTDFELEIDLAYSVFPTTVGTTTTEASVEAPITSTGH